MHREQKGQVLADGQRLLAGSELARLLKHLKASGTSPYRLGARGQTKSENVRWSFLAHTTRWTSINVLAYRKLKKRDRRGCPVPSLPCGPITEVEKHDDR